MTVVKFFPAFILRKKIFKKLTLQNSFFFYSSFRSKPQQRSSNLMATSKLNKMTSQMSGLSLNKENSKNQKPETKIQDAKVE